METGLKEFRFVNRLKAKDLCDYLGLSKGFVSRIENGQNNLPEKQLRKLLNNDMGWDTSMLTSSDSGVKATASGNSTATININSNNSGVERKDQRNSAPVSTIPIIPMDAHAGSLCDYSEATMEYQCERMVSPISGASCAIRITGDSMSPEYNSGDIAILKKINEKAFIEYGKVYCLDTCNGAVIKEIRKCETPGAIECVSLNPDPKYHPFEVAMEYINGWYRVLMVMSLK